MSRIGKSGSKKLNVVKAASKKQAAAPLTGFMSLDGVAPAPGLGTTAMLFRPADTFHVSALLKKADDFNRYYWEITPADLKKLAAKFVVKGDTMEAVSLDPFWKIPLIRAKIAKEFIKNKQLKRDLTYLAKHPTTIVTVTFIPGRLEGGKFDNDDKIYTGTCFSFTEIDGISLAKVNNNPREAGGSDENKDEDEDDDEMNEDEEALGDEETRH